MYTQHFCTKQGENDCIEVHKIGLSHGMIGFITKDGKLFFDTDEDQIEVPVIFLNELKKVFEAAFREQEIRHNINH